MAIDCPEGWADQSLLMVSGSAGTFGVKPSFVVACEIAPGPLPDDPLERLEVFAERQAEQMRTTLPAPVEVQRRSGDTPGAAPELRLDWISDGIPIRQWITYANGANGAVMIATGTTARPDHDAFEPVFRAMLQSFRFI